MKFRTIETHEKPLFLAQHRTLINRLRSVVLMGKLIKKNERYLAEFDIRSVPELLSKIGVPLRQQFDIVMGLRGLSPRHRDNLGKLFDRDADKRFDFEQKLKNTRRELTNLRKRPLTTYEEIEEVGTQISLLQSAIVALENKVSQIPEPVENGQIQTIFAQVPEEKLVDERFIEPGGQGAYPYNLTKKSRMLISTLLGERDKIRGVMDRHGSVRPEDVEIILHEITRLIPKPRRIKLTNEQITHSGEPQPETTSPEATEGEQESQERM